MLDPRPFVPRQDPPASCPSKYVRDGSAGLGLSRRWPGYVERAGRERLRGPRGWLAELHERPPAQRRGMAAGLVVAGLALFAGLARLVRAGSQGPASWGAVAGPSLAVAGVVLATASLGLGPTADEAVGGGVATVLGIVLALARGGGRGGRGGRPGALGLATALLILGLAVSPLADASSGAAVVARLRDQLVLDLGLRWAWAQGLAGVAASFVLAPACLLAAGELGTAIREGSLAGPRERRHVLLGSASAWAAALAVAVAVLLAVRKPGPQPALLVGGAGLVALARLELPSPRRWLLGLALLCVCALVALDDLAHLDPLGPFSPGRDPLSLAALGLALLFAAASCFPQSTTRGRL